MELSRLLVSLGSVTVVVSLCRYHMWLAGLVWMCFHAVDCIRYTLERRSNAAWILAK